MKKRVSLLVLSLALASLPLVGNSLTSCEQTKAKYAINTTTINGVTYSVDKTEAEVDEVVTITISNIQKGKSIEKVLINGTIEATKVSDTVYTFAMVEGDASVSIQLKDILYTIKVSNVDGVELEVPSEIKGGEEVEIKVLNAPIGKYVSAINGVACEKRDDTTFAFIMPFENVTITPVLESTVYSITIEDDSKELVSITKTTAIYNETIEFRVNLPLGKVVNTIDLGDGLTYTFENDKYSFVMPARNVEIGVTLKDDVKVANVSINKTIGYNLEITKKDDSSKVELIESAEGYTFSYINGLTYSYNLSGFDSEIYIPTISLNGEALTRLSGDITLNQDSVNLVISEETITHEIQYDANEIEISGNLTSAYKGQQVKLKGIENDGEKVDTLKVVDENETELEVTFNENEEYPYSFTMANGKVSITVTYTLHYVKLDINDSSVRNLIRDCYLIENGEEVGSGIYINNSNDDKFLFGKTYRVYLNNYYCVDRNGVSHLQNEFKKAQFNGVDLKLHETTLHNAIYYADIVPNAEDNLLSIEAQEHAFIKSKIVDSNNAATVSIYTDASLEEQYKTDNYYSRKEHFVKIEAKEGFEIRNVKFSYNYYKYDAYYGGSVISQKVTTTQEDNVYSFKTDYTYEHYCEITLTIESSKVYNYEGKAFVGDYATVNFYQGNISNTAIQSSSLKTLSIKKTGSVQIDNSERFLASELDEENRILREEGSTAMKKTLYYGDVTAVTNDSDTNINDRYISAKIPEAKTVDDFRYIAKTFGGTQGKDYTFFQYYLKNDTEEFVPYAAVFTNNIDNIVYNDVEVEFVSGDTLITTDTVVFDVKKGNEVIATISTSSKETKLVSEEDLIERNITVSSSECDVTLDKTTALAGEKVTVTLSNVPANKVVNKVLFNDQECTKESENVYSFICPTSDVLVSVELNETYAIALTESVNYVLSSDKTSATAGETVTVTVSNVLAGQEVDKVMVTGENTSLEATTNGKTFTFVMPNEAVTVSVILKEMVGIDTPFNNKTYTGKYTYESEDEYYGDYTIDEYTLTFTFGDDGKHVNASLSYVSNGYSISSKTYNDATYEYTLNETDETKGTLKIQLDENTSLTLTYTIASDMLEPDRDLTIGSTTYYLRQIDLKAN